MEVNESRKLKKDAAVAIVDSAEVDEDLRYFLIKKIKNIDDVIEDFQCFIFTIMKYEIINAEDSEILVKLVEECWGQWEIVRFFIYIINEMKKKKLF